MGDPQDTPTDKPKKAYRKPDHKPLDPRAAIAKLEPLALAGDEAAQRLMKLITEKHGPGSDS